MELEYLGVCSEVKSIHQWHKGETAGIVAADFVLLYGSECYPGGAVSGKVCWLADCNFLDLFSGSGAIGIEALSRGALKACFVEQSKSAMNCIRENLKNTKLDAYAELYETDVISALKRMKGKKFDYVFMDPPYDMLLEKKVLEYLASADLLSEDALIIVEASIDTNFDYVENLGFTIVKSKDYKSNKHVFIEKVL